MIVSTKKVLNRKLRKKLKIYTYQHFSVLLDVFVHMNRSKIRYLSTEKLRKITGIEATNHFPVEQFHISVRLYCIVHLLNRFQNIKKNYSSPAFFDHSK